MADNIEEHILRLRDDFSGPMNDAQRETQELRAGMGDLNDTIDKVQIAAVAIGIGYAMKEATMAVVQTLGEFERFEAVLTNTLGSGSAAQSALDMISDFAATTPFQVNELTGSFVKLANQGFVPVQSEMTSLGDLAASTGKTFDMLTEALLDAQVGEFERLKEFGIRAQSEGDRVKFTFKGVTTEVAKTDQAIRDYILSLGQAEGVTGSMAAIAGTTEGMLSNLADQVTQLKLQIGEALAPVIKGVISALQTMTGAIGSVIDWVQQSGPVIQAFIAGIGGITVALAALVGIMAIKITLMPVITSLMAAFNAVLIANPIGLIVIAVAGLIAAMVVLYKNVEPVREVLDKVGRVIKGVVVVAIDAFNSALDYLRANWEQIREVLEFAIMLLVKLAFWPVFIGKEIIKLANRFEVFRNAIDKVREFLQPVVDLVQKLIDGMKELFTYLERKGSQGNSWQGLNAAIQAQGGPSVLTQQGSGMFANLFDAISQGPSGPMSGISGAQSNIKGGISEVKAGAPKTFNINITKLVEKLEINSSTLNQSVDQIEQMVTEALLRATNDLQIISE